MATTKRGGTAGRKISDGAAGARKSAVTTARTRADPKKPAATKAVPPRKATRSAAASAKASVDTPGAALARFVKDGGIDPLKVSRDLGITKADLAETLGLPADALVREERIMADKTQARLTELLEILRRVETWSGGLRPAFAWYRSSGIPALGDETAEAMVKTNRAGHVRTYLNAIAAGGFA